MIREIQILSSGKNIYEILLDLWNMESMLTIIVF